MQITTLTVGIVGTCCYILSRENSTDCIVIDPGAEPERIRRAANGKRIAAILLTHGHFDHIGAVAALKEEDTPVLIHELDAPMLGDPDLNVSRPLIRRDVTAPPATDLLQEGSRRTLAGLNIEVLHTPGHTPGSVTYRIGDTLFTGDTMFRGSCGRTDFPGGSWAEELRSLQRLKALPGDLPVYPGHGEETSLGEERRTFH